MLWWEIIIILIDTKGSYVPVVWDNRYNSDSGQYDGINDYYISRIRTTLTKDLYISGNIYSADEKSIFVKRSVCIGKRSEGNYAIDRTEECQQTLDEDYVSLPILYDYYIVSTDPNCKSIVDESCNNYNFLNEHAGSFTQTGSKERSNYVYQIGRSDYLTHANYSKRVSFITFISNVSYSSGKGTEDDPYMIK